MTVQGAQTKGIDMGLKPLTLARIAAFAAAVAAPVAAFAEDPAYDARLSRYSYSVKTVLTPTVQAWMSPDIGSAWRSGYRGQGTTITVVDDFSSAYGFSGNLGTGTQVLRHGQWTSREAGLVAPSATIVQQDYYAGATVRLARRGLNVVNLSYGMYADAGYDPATIKWSAQESSILSYARGGKAVVAKAAGNEGVAVGSVDGDGTQDYLSLALAGASSVIFVGALDANGTTAAPAQLADYSDFAGTNPGIQSRYLVVGVEGDKTEGLYGTSFAAPIVSGYAAILGSKFTSASPTTISNQLLRTARKDTVAGYDAAIYGQGEASLSRALAPYSIK